MNPYDKFYGYLQELDDSYGLLADLLRKKLWAVKQNDIETMDELVKQEQVYVLLAKGFNGNIAGHRDKLNLTGTTLSQIIIELPDEEKARFQQLYASLKVTLDAVKGLNDKCQLVIEDRLHFLDKAKKKIDKNENAASYHPASDAKPGPAGQFFTKSI